MVDVIAGIVIWFVVKVLDALPGKFVDAVFGYLGRKRPVLKPKPYLFSPYPPDCGDRGINLGYRRPYVAEYFGGYFAGLLEDTGGYMRIDEQVDCPATPETANLASIARILYEFRRPTGPRLTVIAAAGGMGKTTLAAKIVKCLHEQKDAEFILGDSAKTEHTDPATGHIYKLDPSFRDVRSFYRRLYTQVGLPAPPANVLTRRMIDTLNEQLRDFPAVIVVDNLDTVANVDVLLSTLQPLLSRNVRAVATTRTITSVEAVSPLALTVHLKPLSSIETARSFLHWHIQHYLPKRPRLAGVEKGLTDRRDVEALIKKTGGVPLVMQLVLNDVETKTWAYVERLPALHLSSEFLDYLYKARWEELDRLSAVGTVAQQLIGFVGTQQMKGKRVTFDELNKWAQKVGGRAVLSDALDALEDRFLILNRDTEKGNFSVFPSLAEFVQKKVAAHVSTN